MIGTMLHYREKTHDGYIVGHLLSFNVLGIHYCFKQGEENAQATSIQKQERFQDGCDQNAGTRTSRSDDQAIYSQRKVCCGTS